MQKVEDQINLLEYEYAPDQVVTVDLKGHHILGVMQVLDAIVKDNTHSVFLNGYQSQATPKFVDFEGNQKLDSVEVTWEGYPNANSFFNQVPTEGLSVLGAHALDLLTVFKGVQKNLIDQGVAKKQTQL